MFAFSEDFSTFLENRVGKQRIICSLLNKINWEMMPITPIDSPLSEVTNIRIYWDGQSLDNVSNQTLIIADQCTII